MLAAAGGLYLPGLVLGAFCGIAVYNDASGECRTTSARSTMNL
jgi:hypothetical protein